MIPLEPTGIRGSNNAQKIWRRSCPVVTYPPPSTGTNYNLIDKVEHDPADRIIWHRIHAPEGSFVYDYDLIRANQKDIQRMCLDCHRAKVHGMKRLCTACANSHRRASNRKSQSNRRSRVRKTGFSLVRAEALTEAVGTSRYVDMVDIDGANRSRK